MADLSFLDDSQLDQLVGSKKLSPETADAIRARRAPASIGTSIDGFVNGINDAVSDPSAFAGKIGNAISEIPSTIGGIPDALNSAVGSANSAAAGAMAANTGGVPTAPTSIKGTAPASNELPIQAPERVDLSMLATAAKPSAAPQVANPLASSGLNGAYAKQQRGIEGMYDAQAQAAEGQAGLYNQAAEQAKGYDDQSKALAASRKSISDEHFKNLETMQKEAEKTYQVNPNRYWESKNTGSKIASLVGIFLGGFGAGIQGKGGNPVMDQINKEIERDIGAQKDAYAMARNKIADRQSMYALTMNELGNEQAALLASKASALQMVDIQAKALAAKYQSPQLKAQAELLSGKVQEEQSKLKMALLQVTGQTVAARQAATTGVENPSLLPKDMQEKAVQLPNGMWKAAVSLEGATKVREIQMAGKNVTTITNQMRNIQGVALPFSQKAALGEQLKNDLRTQLLKMKGLGVPTGKDVEMVDALGVDPTSWRQDIVSAKLDALGQNITTSVDNAIGTYVPGYSPIRRGAPVSQRK